MPPVGYKHIVVAAMPGSQPDIVKATGMSASTVKRWVYEMHRNGECHITGWKRTMGTGGHFQPIYTMGAGVDAKCKLKPWTDKIYSQRYRAKIKGTEVGDKREARDRMRWWKKKAANGDALVNALFGRTV